MRFNTYYQAYETRVYISLEIYPSDGGSRIGNPGNGGRVVTESGGGSYGSYGGGGSYSGGSIADL